MSNIIEQALHINEISELKLLSRQYSRLYFGSGFCNWRIPSLSEVEEIVGFAGSKDIALTMVTSYCSDSYILQYKQIIEYIIKRHPKLEVVINDWGIFKLCKDLPIKMVLGRLLVKQKRDPRLAELTGTLPPEARKRIRGLGLNKYLLNFLCKENVKRIELDNVSQGIDLTETNNELLFSLNIPYVYITLSRYCKFNIKSSKDRFKFSRCSSKRCGSIEICNKNIKSPLFLQGNALFYKNYILPEDLEHSKIDRIVYDSSILTNQ